MDKHISKRQERILEFLGEYIEENGYPPSIREIGTAAGISSTSVVSYNLRRLEEKGYISRDKEVSRGLKLTSAAFAQVQVAPEAVVRVPVLGRIVAGAPIPVPASDFPLMGDETIELTRDILGDPTGLYALQVEGDSMIDALVHDGDIVVMRHQRRVPVTGHRQYSGVILAHCVHHARRSSVIAGIRQITDQQHHIRCR